MATEVQMPQLGLTMKEGLITEWKKHAGEAVKRGEPLFSVENDKATIDVDAQVDGVLARIVVEEMITVPVGSVVGIIAAPGENLSASAVAPAEASAPKAPALMASGKVSTPIASASPVASAPESADGFVLASPLARATARALGVSLSSVRGTGPQGAVIARDMPVVGAESTQASAPDYEDQGLSRIGRIAAERMALSWATIPQFTLYDEADAGQVLKLIERYKRLGEPVTITAVMAKLLAHAAIRHPLINSSWLADGKIRTYKKVNINVAIDTKEGLVVPVLRDCSATGFVALGRTLKQMSEEARSGTLQPEDFAGGTITISNLGMFGIKNFRAIINPPQAAILAVGGLERRLVGIGTGFETKPIIGYSLTADHRVVDGAYAARFMANLKELIEDPLVALD